MPKRKRGTENSAVRSVLTLPVEFFTDPFTPLLAHLPNSTRIANVSTLQGDLRNDRAGRDGQRMILQQQMYPKPEGLSDPPVCLRYQARVYRVPLQETALTAAQNLHSEFPLYSYEKERRATVQGHEASWRRLGVGRPRKAMAWLLLLPHPSRARKPQGPGQAQVRSFGPHSHSGHIDRLHVSLQFICPPVPVSVSKQAHTAVQGAKSYQTLECKAYRTLVWNGEASFCQ